MFLRLLFVLLIALNIAVGAWLLLGQDDVHGRSVTDPGVPVLQLLSELPPSAATSAPSASQTATPAVAASVPGTAAAPAVPVPTPATASYSCMSLGPFPTERELNDARARLAARSVRTRSRQEQATRSRGWWVYLPAAASHAQAVEQARQLGARHITDVVVVSGGEQPNTISLGLFKDPDNARKRRDEVAAAGFHPQITERAERVPEYWLDLVLADGASLDWRKQVAVAGVGSHSTGCF
jgi:hypothetical protein